jgi:4-amino-4-deoxy-L-arabinose transferase-like glycosyltransferase
MKSNVATERLKQPGFVITVDQTGSRQKVSALLATNWLRLSGLTSLAFCIRLLMVKYSWGLDGDGVWYATLGKNLVAGDFKAGLSAYWPPLYPFLVGISSLVIHDLEFAGRFVSVLTGSLLVIPVYYLCLRLYGRPAAFVGGLLIATQVLLITASTSLMADATYVFLLISAIVLGLFSLGKARGHLFLLTGLAFAASYLVRPEAIAYIGLVTLLALAGRLYNKRVSRKQIILNCVLLLTGFLLLAGPYLFYIHERTGTWTISQKLAGNLSTSELSWRHLTPDGQTTRADILWGGFRPESTMAPPSPPPPTDSNTSGFGRLLRIAVESSRRLPWVDLRFRQIISPLLVLLVGLGLFSARWSKADATAQIYLLLFALATVLGYSLTVLQDRYLLPLVPLLICWSAQGVVVFESWLVDSLGNARKSTGEFWRKWRLGQALIIGILLVSTTPIIVNFMTHVEYPPRSVAAWIREHSGPSPLIMASGPWPAFLSGGRHLYLPNEEYSVVINYAQHKGVKYLVVEEQLIAKTPSLKFLLEGQDQSELKLVHKEGATDGFKVLVYELVNQPVNK